MIQIYATLGGCWFLVVVLSSWCFALFESAIVRAMKPFSERTRRVLLGVIVALAIAMTAIVLAACLSAFIWYIRDLKSEGVYFLVFFINKVIYQPGLILLLSIMFMRFDYVLKRLDLNLSRSEKVPAYMAHLFIIGLIVLGLFSDSGDIFHTKWGIWYESVHGGGAD